MYHETPRACLLMSQPDAFTIDSWTDIFNSHGIDFVTHTSTTDLFDLLFKERFDLLFIYSIALDDSLRRIVDTLKSENIDIGVIVISSADISSPTAAAKRLGVDDVFSHPFLAVEDTLARIDHVLDIHRLRSQNRSISLDLLSKDEYLDRLLVRDQLTDLYNHAHFQERLEQEVHRANRYLYSVSLLLIDMDDFKKLNSSLGHSSGDRLIERISSIIQSTSRVSDCGFFLRSTDVAARYGGDEFSIILPHTSKEGAAALADRLRHGIAKHDFGLGDSISSTVSIGVATLPDDASNKDGLLHAADMALYCAKEQGRNRTIVFSPEIGRSVESFRGDGDSDYFKRLIALEWSIAEKSFHFVYQPIIDAKSGDVFGYEALCRPEHPLFTSPTDAFRTAQSAGRVQPLGRLLRRLAVGPIAQLPTSSLLFINLHPQELNDDSLRVPEDCFVPWINRIVFEITEVEVVQDSVRVRSTLSALKELGFRIAVDDLGSGYSGLQSISVLRPDFVKLDMHLVRNIDSNPSTARLVKHLCEFAQGEGIQIIAEGVENEAEHLAIQSLGCSLIQGYLICYPGPAFPEVT